MSNWDNACDLLKSFRPLSDQEMKNLRGTTAAGREAKRLQRRKSAELRAKLPDVEKTYAKLAREGRAPKLIPGKSSVESPSGARRAETVLKRVRGEGAIVNKPTPKSRNY